MVNGNNGKVTAYSSDTAILPVAKGIGPCILLFQMDQLVHIRNLVNPCLPLVVAEKAPFAWMDQEVCDSTFHNDGAWDPRSGTLTLRSKIAQPVDKYPDGHRWVCSGKVSPCCSETKNLLRGIKQRKTPRIAEISAGAAVK